MKDKKIIGKRILNVTSFVAIFMAILTVLTLIFIPKFDGDGRQMRGFYHEEEDSMDVLMIGSCNMYSSYSPVIAYEQTGLVSYAYCCPDQEICTAYHYLKEALNRQENIQLVVLESLFLTCEPTEKREYYNRLALEYMRPSLNKLEMIYELGTMESEYMQTVDPSAPGKALTYAGYLFPLLRYHGREDVLWEEDVAYWWENDDYMVLKGGIPLYSYLKNNTLDFRFVANGETIRDTSREYFIKMQELCEKEGIELLLVKSPNHYRWDDEATAAVRDFAEERGVTLLDFKDYGDFILSDYSSTTGRLNVYGMKKFTEHMMDYIAENYDIERTPISEENKKLWDDCVKLFHETSAEKQMPIDENTVYRIFNENTGIKILWNHCFDAQSYDVYRCVGKQGTFEKVATVEGTEYLDENVVPGQGYTYYIKPTEGKYQGVASNQKYYVFVDDPTNVTAVNTDGKVSLNWTPPTGTTSYVIQRKPGDYLNYEYWDDFTTTTTDYLNSGKLESGTLYDYRLRGVIEEDDTKYYSAGTVASAVPLTTPQIVSAVSSEASATIKWNKIENGTSYEIYRRAEDEAEFTLCADVKATETSFTDTTVTAGKQYFYKIVLTKKVFEAMGRSDESNTVGIKIAG